MSADNFSASLAAVLTQKRLKELLSYDPESGLFTWLVARTFTARVGTIAGSLNSNGYVRIKVDGIEYLAHRLAWLYVKGEWPDPEIDHENGIRHDNRFDNFRIANSMQQRANSKLNSDNTSGYRGVYWNKRRKKWRAHIQREHLGYFTTKEAAAAAYSLAFDERFGAEYRRV